MTLASIIERIEAGETGRELEAEIGEALGWSLRKVTRLGLNGRTPGSYLWFDPEGVGPRALPRFTGPRKRDATIAALKSRMEQ